MSGSGVSVEALFLRERANMFTLARLLTGSDETAEDILQEAFTRLQARTKTVSNPGGYLRITVVNLCQDYHRRLKLDRLTPYPIAEAVPAAEIDEVWAVVCRMRFSYRAVITLRYYLRLTETEIAETLGCRPGTVKSRLHRALAELRSKPQLMGWNHD
jgi:RNA polymerase sigma factor (sigma-70 family)